MDIKDLKSAWDRYSSQEMDKHRLGKESIQEMLKNKTKNLIELIDRNIRIGLGILLLFVAYVVLDDLYLSKILIRETIQYPVWLIYFDVFSNFLIVTTYLYFVIRYFKIKRTFSTDLHLKDLLTGIIETLMIYRRMFYLAVGILLLNITVSFTAGLYAGLKISSDNLPGGLEQFSTIKIMSVLGIGLLVLIPIVGLTFMLLRWGFNKLYGRYLNSLNQTLQELDETDITE